VSNPQTASIKRKATGGNKALGSKKEMCKKTHTSAILHRFKSHGSNVWHTRIGLFTNPITKELTKPSKLETKCQSHMEKVFCSNHKEGFIQPDIP
jgi:hypothetical protein